MKKQKSIIRTLTNRSFRKKKSRNAVAVLAVILTTMMFTTLFTLTQSMGKHLTEMYLRQSGTTAQASAKYITDAQIARIAAHPDVVSSGWSLVLGITENERLAGRQVEIRYGTDQYAEESFSLPTTGHMPEKPDEIAMDTYTLERLGIPLELGEQVTLEWRKDLYTSEMTSSTFVLCGWWEGNASVYTDMAWVSEEFARDACGNVEEPASGQICGQRMMSVNFTENAEIEEAMNSVLEDCGLTELEFQVNLAYSPEIQQNIFQENLPLYGGMVLVFVAGYLIIYNVFQISVASDISFYGRLKTLGMTKKQIQKMIYGQGSLISLLGIPVGLVLGYLLGTRLVPVLLAGTGTVSTASVHPVIFFGAALFAYVTVQISCMLPARIAGKVPPMEALRYTDADTGIKKQKKKTRKSFFLAGMAWENLWRNRRRTVMVICSLTLGLVLMSFFYAKNASFDVEKYLLDLSVADYQLDDATNAAADGYDSESRTLDDTLLSKIAAVGNIEAEGRLYTHEMVQAAGSRAQKNLSEYYTQERLDDFASFDPTFPEWKKSFDIAVNGGEVPHTVYGADGLILEAAASDNYLLDGVYDAEKFASGNYALAIGPAVEPGSGVPTYSVGENVEIGGRTFTVMAVLSPLQPMVEGSYPVFDLSLVIPADVFTKIWPNSNLRKYYFNVPDESVEAVQELLADYQNKFAPGMKITSRQTMADQYESQTRAASVTGYAISVVIALVGILNFINSMVTSIVSRKKEFAMIQSVGMTKRQLRRMLTFEGIYYAGLTLVISYGLSAAAVGVIVRAVTADGYSTFHFTLLPLLICTPVLLLFAVFIPYLCFQNLEQQSIVERLRTENF